MNLIISLAFCPIANVLGCKTKCQATAIGHSKTMLEHFSLFFSIMHNIFFNELIKCMEYLYF